MMLAALSQAGVSLSLDDPNMTVARPTSGTSLIAVTGTITATSPYTYAGNGVSYPTSNGVDYLQNDTGPRSTSRSRTASTRACSSN